MRTRMREHIEQRAQSAIEEKVFPGCVVGVVKNGERTVLPFGRFTYEENSNPVKEDTIYDVASITKSIPTASLALTLIDEGKLKLGDRFIDYIPEFRNSDREAVTIRHLLNYEVGGYALSSLKERSAKELYEEIMTREFSFRPGERSAYSNLPSFLLGLAVEKAGGDPLDKLAQKYFFDPLKMNHTSFWPQYFSREEIAPTEIEEWRGHVQGSVHDESAYVFTVLGPRAVGHAGLFSSAPDLLNFLEMLLHGGAITDSAEKGLGWQVNEAWMGPHRSTKTFGKTGFTGTSVAVDRERGSALAILSNRTWPKRTDTNAIAAFRSDIADAVFEAY
jgi:CubicO group peptidase (beta-lactamase class C family)